LVVIALIDNLLRVKAVRSCILSALVFCPRRG
jgi:hypothetical protein